MSKMVFAGIAHGADRVDMDKGVIYGASVVSVGKAQGHGVQIGESFVDSVIAAGNEKTGGVFVRFGHPNMCSSALGKFYGRLKNLRAVGDGETYRAVGDVFSSNTAKETPHGNLRAYVLNMAKQEPDAFGMSIVFDPSRLYKLDDAGDPVYEDDDPAMFDALDSMPFVELSKLHYCDIVDSPAANSGLFSSFANETAAGQITQFLDQHPEVWNALSSDPEVLKVMAKHADKIDEFRARYTSYRAQGKNKATEDKTMADNNEQTLEAEGADNVNTPETEPVELESAEAEPETPEAAEPATEPEQLETEPETDTETETREQPDARAEFARMREAFGDEIAAATFASGGSYSDAQTAYIAKLESDRDTLRKQLEAKGEEVDAAEFSEGKTKPRSLTELARRNNKR